MSYQYINPNLINNYAYYPVQYNSQTVPVQPQYMQNPYQASFYNQSLVYPYMPINQQNINADYISLGTIKSSNNDTVHLFKLKNGQKIAIMPKKNVGTIVKTYLNGGSMNESDELRGISHTIEHMLFKGSNNLADGDVFNLTGKMGASTNASTDYAQTDYYITAPYMSDEDFKKTIEIQGDMISNPLFEKAALESEKNPICSEISMIDDRVETPAFDKVIRNLFQINSTSHNLVAGSIETVQGLQREDLVKHHQKYYSPDELYTVVVGDVDVNRTIDLISKNYTIKSNPSQQEKHIQELKPIQKSVREDIRSSKTNSTQVYMGFSGPKPTEGRDFVIYNMLSYFLNYCSSSELKNGLEEISGQSDCSAQKVGLKKDDPYAIVNVMILNPNDEQKGIDLFYDTISRIQSLGISKDELTAMKNYISKAYEFEMCNCSNICDDIGINMIDETLDSFTNYESIINSISVDDIKKFTQKYFDLSKVSMVVVHPANISEEEIKNNYKKSKYACVTSQNNNINFKGNTPKVTIGEIEEYRLNNNTNLAINNTDSNICAYKWSVNTPPIKPKNPNIPAVLTYMFQKGSQYLNQDELEKYKELNGIDATVEAHGKSIQISANCLPDNAAKTLALINELMYRPKLTQEDFDSAKRFVKDTLKTSQKDAGTTLLDKLYPGFFPTEATMLKTIDELTLDDIKEFYQQLLQNASSSFSATIPKDKYPFLKDLVFEYQNQAPITFKEKINTPTAIFENNDTEKIIYDTDDLNQAQIYKTYQFPMSGNIEDEAKFELLNMILGGSANARLFSDLREKENLAYSVYSSINSFENTGILTLEIQTTTDNPEAGIKSYDNVKKSLEGFKKHTDLLCKELVTDDELNSAKTKLKQQLIYQTQNPTLSTSLINTNMMQPYGIKRIDKYIEAIDKITKEDIKKAANYIFSYKPTTSILASKDTIDSQLSYLKTQGELQQAN